MPWPGSTSTPYSTASILTRVLRQCWSRSACRCKERKPMGANDLPTPWNPIQRILFRFACAYLVLFILPFPLDLTPYDESEEWKPSQPYTDLWNEVVPWVGAQ